VVLHGGSDLGQFVWGMLRGGEGEGEGEGGGEEERERERERNAAPRVALHDANSLSSNCR
jgi:hypothetical protein